MRPSKTIESGKDQARNVNEVYAVIDKVYLSRARREKTALLR